MTEEKHVEAHAPRPAERAFFRAYWNMESVTIRRWYGYQWFLRPCRAFVFACLHAGPPGPVLEVGSGRGSVTPDEECPSRIALDIVSCHPPGVQRVIGDVQSLPFREGSLAGIWGQTMLMHVSPDLVARESHRALRPGGVWAVVEPLDRHPLVRIARRSLPGRRVNPRFMSMRDLARLSMRFSATTFEFFFLLSPVALVTNRRVTPLINRLQALDGALLRRAPALRRYAWYVAACFTK